MRHLRLRPVWLFLLPSKSNPPYLHLCSTAAAIADPLLSEADLLTPRLCHSDHLPHTVRLLAAALSATAHLLTSFPLLLDHLTSHPFMADSMALINRLKYNPSSTQTSLLPVTRTLLIDSYLTKRRPKEALKVFRWMLRPDSICPPDQEMFRVLVSGLFDFRAGCEGLRAFKEMLWAGFTPGPELRKVVYRGLLRLAMVKEVVAFDAALECVDVDGVDKALNLLDDIIAWLRILSPEAHHSVAA